MVLVTKSQKESSNNKPRNHLIKDATSPFHFIYYHQKFGKSISVTVNQTNDDDVWPGGALWDIGVLLSKVLVLVNSTCSTSTSTSTSTTHGGCCNNNSTKKHNNKQKRSNDIFIIPRLVAAFGIWPNCWKDCIILELGCGVGLSGLVASSLGARFTLLTDLKDVVDKVTQTNVTINKLVLCTAKSSEKKKQNKCIAMPLCWGNVEDEMACAKIMDEMYLSNSGKKKPSIRKKKKKHLLPTGRTTTNTTTNTTAISTDKDDLQSKDVTPTKENRIGKPDIILIGDVAYQHKPGASSHFDVLLSTLLKFVGDNTIVVFGTRMRMPASVDLLNMFRSHLDEIVQPPIEAHEIDVAFQGKNLGRKHHITIHVFKGRKSDIMKH